MDDDDEIPEDDSAPLNLLGSLPQINALGFTPEILKSVRRQQEDAERLMRAITPAVNQRLSEVVAQIDGLGEGDFLEEMRRNFESTVASIELPEPSALNIPPNPVHETNRRLSELHALLEQQSVEAAAREAAVTLREDAATAREIASARRERILVRLTVVGVGSGVVGAIVAVIALFAR